MLEQNSCRWSKKNSCKWSQKIIKKAARKMGLHLAATRGGSTGRGLNITSVLGWKLEAIQVKKTPVFTIVPCRKKRFWNWSAELPLKNPSQSDTCLVASGSEKRWLSLHQVSNPFPASFWRTRSLADPVHKLAGK